MPWKETNVMDQKKEFVLESFKDNCNFTELCTKFGISTKTGYKWKLRFIEKGFQGLSELSRKPNNSPVKLSEDIILDVIRLKLRKKNWGAKKIRQIYSNNNPGKVIPSVSSFTRILNKAGLTNPRKKRRKGFGFRIENRITPEKPNEVWTVDFKGWWYTPLDEKCNPLTIRDEYTRYILSIKALEKGDIPAVKAEFESVFKKYGLPDIIKSDNGPPFASKSSLMGLTKLSVWWLSLGIKLDRIKPASPYQNGGHERMHLDMKNELESQIDGDIRNHQNVFESWRKEFNEERPHESLKMKTPGSIYSKSERKYESGIIDFDYPANYRERIVNDRGFINYNRIRYFIGYPFSYYKVGLEIKRNGEVKIYFGNNYLGKLDLDSRLIIPEDFNRMSNNKSVTDVLS
jgi:transposase InsO family protein